MGDVMITNTLCDSWRLPTYAESYVQLATSAGDTLPMTGAHGTFNIDAKADTLTVLWGDAPLSQLAWQDTSLDWTGAVRLGGFVTAIHFAHLAQLEMDLAVMTVEAYPLKPDVKPYLSASHRDNFPYAPADFLSGIDDDQSEGVTTWLADMDSPLVGLMQDAMNQAHRVYAFGQLASDEQGWHHLFALPILLESVTTFMR